LITVFPLGSSRSRSSGPQTTVTSGYVESPDAFTRTRRSALNTRHGVPRSETASSAMTLAAIAACSGEPPAIAHACPSRNLVLDRRDLLERDVLAKGEALPDRRHRGEP
jgi:hypothetical protein